METIEERATKYACDGCMPDGIECDSCYNIHGKCERDAYIAGAKAERKVLTKWNDPKEPPERGKDVLLKLRYEADAEPSYTVGYWNGIYYGDALGADTEIIDWREIHE